MYFGKSYFGNEFFNYRAKTFILLYIQSDKFRYRNSHRENIPSVQSLFQHKLNAKAKEFSCLFLSTLLLNRATGQTLCRQQRKDTSALRFYWRLAALRVSVSTRVFRNVRVPSRTYSRKHPESKTSKFNSDNDSGGVWLHAQINFRRNICTQQLRNDMKSISFTRLYYLTYNSMSLLFNAYKNNQSRNLLLLFTTQKTFFYSLVL